MRRAVTAAARRILRYGASLLGALLLESGDPLLTESGDVIEHG
jgi:hypothetical protein